MKATGERVEEDIADAFDYETTMERWSAKGSASKSSVLEQIAVLKAMLC